MTKKRPPSPNLIPNPFIKKKNLEWTLDSPSTTQTAHSSLIPLPPPTTADIESGSTTIDDHLSHFQAHLSKHVITPSPLLSIQSYASLYSSNIGNPEGAHFVIHQHDHPIAGTHYDLRLQINETSSASWAIMYGLPGDPNSTRLNRNATETRIHCLWAHYLYGTLEHTLYSPGGASTHRHPIPHHHHHHQIHHPKQPHKLSYTPPFKDARSASACTALAYRTLTFLTSASPNQRTLLGERKVDERLELNAVVGVEALRSHTANAEKLSAMEREIRELEDEQVRLTNAYPGASNTIGSVHQRRCVVTGQRGADILKDEGVNNFVQRKGWKPVLN
ncbi:uncharacterized protein NECHADRAFT_75306 [Fusarium vanettenii 77-13-4]|uniref:DNA ligase D 3'-phosphoesterase domain-containing protein n=1 Tax=Fusarium vanettenii (strain ATCC MYA-4622 / CBS 123669 / FGSC 9596 / NRRL 45880 / 77-13-4) TaxID=660122 RepID=C7YIF9_FUSV7|nr:uncharacterized protein NECHADRAFT_75306 [Fusarium vanettenii 77-13-4]EEU48090.1 hypothetical protein NECHADRAFT_75306 [Fusarium vanettenii 77-13-4]